MLMKIYTKSQNGIVYLGEFNSSWLILTDEFNYTDGYLLTTEEFARLIKQGRLTPAHKETYAEVYQEGHAAGRRYEQSKALNPSY